MCDLFGERCPRVGPPSRKGIQKLCQDLKKLAVAELARSGRPTSVCTEENFIDFCYFLLSTSVAISIE